MLSHINDAHDMLVIAEAAIIGAVFGAVYFAAIRITNRRKH